MNLANTRIVSSTVMLMITLIVISNISTDNVDAYAYSITKTSSGLLASDSLTTGNTSDLTTGGTTTSYNYYEDSQGLHIGVQSPQSGNWVNYYANPPQANAHLYHVTINIPQNSISDGVFNPGLYVEGSDYIPHVGCEAYADDTGYYWEVEYSSNAGQTYTTLYISGTSALPHTQDCTIITNGNNLLKVYIGGKSVFSSTTMNLGMSGPLVTFVQDDTSSSTSMHYATFSNYYATTSQNIQITNAPTNAATVEVVDSIGNVLASSPVASGTASLNLGPYNFPLSANINIYDSNNVLLASNPASIYGGDVYSVSGSSITAPGSPTGLAATSVSSSQINLSWTAPSNNGGAAISGYEIERSTNGGVYFVLVQNTGSTSTTYSDTGLSPNTTYTYRVSAINSAGTSLPSTVASATTVTLPITLTTSGLVASDPLNNETESQQQLQTNSKYWKYGGSAQGENAPYDFYRDTQGLHVGVQAPANDAYAGFYAVTPNSTAILFHSRITTPVSSVPSNPSQYYENGMYVQTFEPGPVNYVTCFSITSNSTTYWAIASELGNTNEGTQYTPLYVNASANQPLTRDCTMITNGNNYLKVYLDGNMVYNSTSLNLQMPSPFNAYLEPETSYSGALLNGTFTDYYVATGENIQVKNLPSNANVVSIISSSGSVLSTASVSGGTALLDVGRYNFPLSGTINVYNYNNVVIASTSKNVNIFGGDVYAVG
ncbi:MAG: fibronectin type III domain-containing protein [Thaumarchaeota archaeon]|nr:fibronectin type III domain-containing protein [Nitrososphaerota archaeon]